MFGKPITYTNADDEQVTETYWFHLSKPELMRLQTSFPGGFGKLLQDLVDSNNFNELFQHFEEIIFLAYGKRAPDGKGFEKSDEITQTFRQSFAYEALFDEMLSDDGDKFAAFIRAVLPKNFEKEMAEMGNNVTSLEGPKPPTS